jgi:hypothetical protein
MVEPLLTPISLLIRASGWSALCEKIEGFSKRLSIASEPETLILFIM